MRKNTYCFILIKTHEVRKKDCYYSSFTELTTEVTTSHTFGCHDFQHVPLVITKLDFNGTIVNVSNCTVGLCEVHNIISAFLPFCNYFTRQLHFNICSFKVW